MEGGGEGKTVLHGKYELGRLLGHGTFGKVHVARNLATDRNVAMKVVGKDKVVKVGMAEQLKREISVMKLVTHPNIVELHEVLASRSRIYLAMELVRGGELFSRIARRGRFREDLARRYFRQLISAVDFCHSRGVYHRDLKPENLLLDDKGNLKVADFGLSALADLHPDGLLHTTCGTPAYVAPEVVLARTRGGYDGAKADLWSCGVVLYVMLAGSLPFQDDNLALMYKKMQRGDFRCPPWFSPEARRLVTRLLDPNPATRITVARLMETAWFRRKAAAAAVDGGVVSGRWGKEKPQSLNAFHIISLSEGFDLSPLFEGEVGGGGEGMMRFMARATAKRVVERLEGVAAANGGRYRVVKGSGEGGVRLEGVERGRKGTLAVAAEIFAVAAEVLVVEVKKEAGDSLEYRRFCSEELRPALEDIIWANSPEPEPAAAA